LIVAFIDEMRAEGHAVESICRVLSEQGCQIAARTYRAWAQPGRVVADRTVADAQVVDRVRELAWTVDAHGVRRMAPEGLYGRRKMTALVHRSTPTASPGSVDRAMKTLGLQGIAGPKACGRRSRPRTASALGTCSTATSPHRPRTGSGLWTSPTSTSVTFTDRLADEHLLPSIGSVGDAYDNALTECVIGLYKTECIRTTIFHAGPYRTIADVEYATAGWIDWYNNRRLHGHPCDDDSRGVRERPLRDPQPRAATRMRAAENLGRFISRSPG
jgi:hypothetical protein